MTETMRSLRSAFLKAERALTAGATALGAAALIFALSVGFYQVIARFVLFRSAAWSEPLVQATLVWMTYLALAAAMRTGSLISVDVIARSAPESMRAALRLAAAAAILLLLVVILWFGVTLCWRVRFQTIAGVNIPASYVYAALPTGALMSIIALVAHVLDPPGEAEAVESAE